MTMKRRYFKVLVPGIFAATALALAVSAGAQTPPPPPAAPPPATKSPQAATMTGHHKGSAATAKHDAEMKTMKTQCEAMMATKQEMQDKRQAMDATLDKLVAEMNAAKGSKEVDALEKPMAAVINELVEAKVEKVPPGRGAHIMQPGHMRGGRGEMEAPEKKGGHPPEEKKKEK